MIERVPLPLTNRLSPWIFAVPSIEPETPYVAACWCRQGIPIRQVVAHSCIYIDRSAKIHAVLLNLEMVEAVSIYIYTPHVGGSIQHTLNVVNAVAHKRYRHPTNLRLELDGIYNLYEIVICRIGGVVLTLLKHLNRRLVRRHGCRIVAGRQ